jgi:hypothetical protein
MIPAYISGLMRNNDIRAPIGPVTATGHVIAGLVDHVAVNNYDRLEAVDAQFCQFISRIGAKLRCAVTAYLEPQWTLIRCGRDDDIQDGCPAFSQTRGVRGKHIVGSIARVHVRFDFYLLAERLRVLLVDIVPIPRTIQLAGYREQFAAVLICDFERGVPIWLVPWRGVLRLEVDLYDVDLADAGQHRTRRFEQMMLLRPEPRKTAG